MCMHGKRSHVTRLRHYNTESHQRPWSMEGKDTQPETQGPRERHRHIDEVASTMQAQIGECVVATSD